MTYLTHIRKTVEKGNLQGSMAVAFANALKKKGL